MLRVQVINVVKPQNGLVLKILKIRKMLVIWQDAQKIHCLPASGTFESNSNGLTAMNDLRRLNMKFKNS